MKFVKQQKLLKLTILSWLCLKVMTAYWGQRHLRYIKTERKALYTELLTCGRLNTYLVDINEQATEQMLLLTKQMAECEGVTEQLKAQDQMLWVQRMNSIRDRAIEIVNHELIYA